MEPLESFDQSLYAIYLWIDKQFEKESGLMTLKLFTSERKSPVSRRRFLLHSVRKSLNFYAPDNRITKAANKYKFEILNQGSYFALMATIRDNEHYFPGIELETVEIPKSEREYCITPNDPFGPKPPSEEFFERMEKLEGK